MKCKICNKETKSVFSGKIIDKYSIKYFYCDYCGFLHTEDPYWLDESYSDAITHSDVGLISRNLNAAEITKVLIFSFFSTNSQREIGLLSNKIFRKLLTKIRLKKVFKKVFSKILIKQRFEKIYASPFDANQKFIDYGGGYGIFVRLMRDIGLDFYWYDSHCKNIFAQGFEADLSKKYQLLTAFEVFEHLPDPIRELEKIFKISTNILFSTELLPDKNPPTPTEWWYYGLEHGQHISFFSKKTLEYIADKYELNLYSNNQTVHFFTKESINLKIMNLLFTRTDFLSKLIDETSKPTSLLVKDFDKITSKSLI